jgi:pantetheine-phosphate adenylyltransferase
MLCKEAADMKRAVYAGSFDPPTLGHLHVIETAAKLFDELIVAIGDNPEKKYTFSVTSRIDMLKDSISLLPSSKDGCPPKIQVDHFCNRFLIDYANDKGASYIIRGIRNSQDFEFEKAMRHLNADLAAGITTLFIIPPRELIEISSSVVKGVCGPEGWQRVVQKMVPPPVFTQLLQWKGVSERIEGKQANGLPM